MLVVDRNWYRMIYICIDHVVFKYRECVKSRSYSIFHYVDWDKYYPNLVLDEWL